MLFVQIAIGIIAAFAATKEDKIDDVILRSIGAVREKVNSLPPQDFSVVTTQTYADFYNANKESSTENTKIVDDLKQLTQHLKNAEGQEQTMFTEIVPTFLLNHQLATEANVTEITKKIAEGTVKLIETKESEITNELNTTYEFPNLDDNDLYRVLETAKTEIHKELVNATQASELAVQQGIINAAEAAAKAEANAKALAEEAAAKAEDDAKAMAEEAAAKAEAHAKAVAEAAAEAAKAEARAKALAEAEEAANEKALAEAEKAAKEKALAEAEEAAKAKAKELEEAAKAKALAVAKAKELEAAAEAAAKAAAEAAAKAAAEAQALADTKAAAEAKAKELADAKALAAKNNKHFNKSVKSLKKAEIFKSSAFKRLELTLKKLTAHKRTPTAKVRGVISDRLKGIQRNIDAQKKALNKATIQTDATAAIVSLEALMYEVETYKLYVPKQQNLQHLANQLIEAIKNQIALGKDKQKELPLTISIPEIIGPLGESLETPSRIISTGSMTGTDSAKFALQEEIKTIHKELVQNNTLRKDDYFRLFKEYADNYGSTCVEVKKSEEDDTPDDSSIELPPLNDQIALADSKFGKKFLPPTK